MTSQTTALSEGGEVRGYYDSSMVTNPYRQAYSPIYATPGAMTVGMNAPYIYPGSGGTPGIYPPQAPQEPEGGCPEGMMWNGTMCIIDPNYVAPQRGGGGGSDDDGPDTPAPKPWYEGADLTNPSAYIDGILTPEKEDQSIVGGILSNMPIFQAVGGIGKLSNVAKSRAALEIAKVTQVGGKAKYSEDEIAAMEAKIDKYIEDNGVNRKLADAIASGKMNTSSFMNKFDKNKDGILDFKNDGFGVDPNLKQPTTSEPKKAPVETDPNQQAANITKDRDRDNNRSSEQQAKQANYIKNLRTKDDSKKVVITDRKDSSGRTREEAGSNYKSALRERQEAKAAASKAALNLGLDPNKKRGGKAEGGLMSKKKKK